MMEISKILLTYLATGIVFLVVDLLWLGIVAKDFYNRHLGTLLADNVQWIPAIIFYLIYIAGIVYFAILPGVEKASLIRTLIGGALLGAVAYSAYDLTNLATLKDWPLSVTVVDVIWGTVLTTLVAGFGYYFTLWLQ